MLRAECRAATALQAGGSTLSSANDIADDRLVADYLNRLAAAAASLPADRRAELFEEISVHIAEARTLRDTTGPTPSLSVADLLERLGRPDDIVREAAEDAEPGAAAAIPSQPAPRRRVLDTGTVVLLLVGGFLIGIGWIAGVVMLWVSPRWRTNDKLLGTLVWPGGLAAVLAVPRFGAALPPPVALGLLLVGVTGPILTAVRLLRQASRSAARPPVCPHPHKTA
jgi:hypothetical protein